MSALVSTCQCAIRLAGLVVPRGLRAEWTGGWIGEIRHGHASLTGRGASAAETRRKLLRFTVGAFSDAVDLRRSGTSVRSILRHPAFSLAVPLVLLGGLCAVTHVFQNCRELIAGSPFRESERLMLLVRSATVLGMEAAPTAADLHAWQQHSSGASIAGFLVEGRVLRVTSNFYSVLGAVPRPPFRFMGHRVEAIQLLDRREKRIGVLVRLHSPARPEQVAAELARFVSPTGGFVTATSLASRLHEPLVLSGACFAFMLVIAVAMARGSWRGVLFLIARTALAEGTITAAWAELAAALPLSPMGGFSVAMVFLFPALLVAGAALALWWSIRDMKGRCHVCCRLLAMPVKIGSRSSIILDRPGVEVLCPMGHGMLLIPEPVVQPAEPATWTALDESWKECFSQGGST